MNASLFISYSHRDRNWLKAIKKHLDGMLRTRVRVLTDEDIEPGSSWEMSLRGARRQATGGLVLASPDYLVSRWCREELHALVQARRDGRVNAIFWLLLRPCGWQWTELAELQALQDPASTAASDCPRARRAMPTCSIAAS